MRTNHVKKMNEHAIRQALQGLNKGTVSMIAATTGLSVATCSNLLKKMVASDEVLDMGLEESSGGRPAVCYQYNPDFAYIACIVIELDIDIVSFRYTIVNLDLEEVETDVQQLQQQMKVHLLLELIDSLLLRFPQIKAVGIGVPGAVNEGVINISDIDELVHVPLESMIRERHPIEVTIENDMNLLALGFHRKQGYSDAMSVAVMAFDEAMFPGAGMIVNGHMLNGNTHFAGEISFLPFQRSREQLFNDLHDRSTMPTVVGQALTSLIAILNPAAVALTGRLIRTEDIERIRQQCLLYIPEMHMPKLMLLQQPQTDYVYGLMLRSLENLQHVWMNEASR